MFSAWVSLPEGAALGLSENSPCSLDLPSLTQGISAQPVKLLFPEKSSPKKGYQSLQTATTDDFDFPQS
jgi:hypothetical protein